MATLSAAIRIAEKDLKVELRRSYEILSLLTFSMSSLLLCSFAWRSTGSINPEVASVVLWIILYFTSILVFTTSFSREMDRGTLGGLKTLPCPSISILFGKSIYTLILLLLVELILLPLSVIFLNLNLIGGTGLFLLVFILGVIDLSVAGSFVSSLVLFSEGKNILLSFLLFTICMPVLISSVSATSKILYGNATIRTMPELNLLVAFLLCIITISNFTFKFTLEE